MSVHLGILALMLAITAIAAARWRSARGTTDLVLLICAVLTAGVEGAITFGEARLGAAWHEVSEEELTARSHHIVTFLREKGADALEQIREVGDDPDTHALLENEPTLARTARRPVFLDLNGRYPSDAKSGVTIYDALGTPRAWAGWSPTATTSLEREPSREVESVAIREGNIYTLLEVVHPVREPGGDPLGYVVYQEPLRVQFPLENRLLQVDDVLHELEGGGGVRADVALELRLDEGTDLREIRTGPLKISVTGSVASSTTAILSAGGQPCGRVSLSGLSRAGVLDERLSAPARARGVLLLLVLALVTVRLWNASSATPRLVAPLLRLSLLVAVRWILLVWSPRHGLDPFGLFDPSWFASIRFGGLLRSPGDLLLTAGAALLGLREIRRVVTELEGTLGDFGRRHPFLSAAPAFASALLVGSALGLHWDRVTDVARNANVPLYSGLDPFTSVPVAALELSMLFLGIALLLAADSLGTASLRLLSRWRAPVAWVAVAGLALAASAVKIGTTEEASFLADFLRPIPALAAIAGFHWAARRWGRPGGIAILVTGLLAAVVNVNPLFEATEAKRKARVELFAREHTESPSNWRHSLLRHTLEYLATSEELLDTIENGPGPSQANLAFILWARSPLANETGCHVRIRDASGETFSRFSIAFPAELRDPLELASSAPGKAVTTFRREEVGSSRIDLYVGAIPLTRNGRRLGTLDLALSYPDKLGDPSPSGDDLGGVFTNLSPPDAFLRFSQDAPDRIDRYRGETLVASTDPEGGLGKRVPPIIVQALSDPSAEGRWVERRIADRNWDIYCVRERDGNVTVGYLTFGLERYDWARSAELIARSMLVTLVLASGLIAALMLGSRLLPDGLAPQRVDVPQLGFRERVIGGFLVVSLLPTVFLGLAGQGLFVQEKRQEFEERLEDDLRVSQELLGRRLSDAASNAAGTEEVLALFREQQAFRTLSPPASVDGIVVVSANRQPLGASPTAELDLLLLPGAFRSPEGTLEFFRKRGNAIYACAVAPVPALDGGSGPDVGAVLAFRNLDDVIAAELERRVGSSLSIFSDGRLRATSKPELYQSEILSDLLDSRAYQKIELEAARRTLLEENVGRTAFLSSFAPLLDAGGDPAGVVATIAPFHGGGLDVRASKVLSRIYFLCLLVLAVAIVAAVLLANRITRPISDLTQGAERIGAGTFGERIRSRATGEIGQLVRSFNQMSARLASSEARDRERREYIEAIIRHVGSGVVSFDAEGRVATVNEAAARILDVRPSELIGAAPTELPPHGALTAVLAAVEPVLTGRQEEAVEELEVSPPGEDEGELRSFRLVATRLTDSRDRPQGAVAVFEDLTDLIRSKKITAWAEMARQVAHEIKNPLTPMKLSAQHLQQAWRDRHPKFDRILEESTETIVDRCEALRRIAIEFSDYARMPGRRIRREDLGELLREARRLYGEADGRAVDFRLDAPESSLWTRVDKDEVMRLFINLIENSIQAMPEGGDLDVLATRENGNAFVTIRDTGVGISADNLKRIFEPSFSTKTGGAGLGLPICRAIMEDYGGSIDIHSEAGSGTTVTLCFPVDESGGAVVEPD